MSDIKSQFTMPAIHAALCRSANRRAEWLDTLDERDPVRLLSLISNAASLYMLQPFERERTTLRELIQQVDEIEGALIAQAIEARRAETGTGSVHESAVPEGDAS